MITLLERLQTELDKYRWIPVSERLPTLEDGKSIDGTVDVLGVEKGILFIGNYYPKMNMWNYWWNCCAEPDFWKPIILPTEEKMVEEKNNDIL